MADSIDRAIVEGRVYPSASDILPGGTATAALPDWSLLRLSPGLLALTGWESAEALIQASGGALYDLFCPEDRPCILAALESLLASAGRIKAEYRLLRRSLPPLWVTLCAGLVYTEALGIHLECFLLDLSDLRRAEAELSERCQTLAEQARRETMTGLLNKDAFRRPHLPFRRRAGGDLRPVGDRPGRLQTVQRPLRPHLWGSGPAGLCRHPVPQFWARCPVRTVWGRRVCGLSARDRSPDR